MPAGQDAAEDERYFDLTSEIAKLESLTADQEPNWPKVVELSAGLLRESSKDLRVATYLCAGLFEAEGDEAEQLGLGVVRDLCEQFWPEPGAAEPDLF
jgi:predicted component of type VI protein secretion system